MFELMPWRGHRDLGLLRAEMDSLFDRFFDGWPFSLSKKNSEWMPSVDVSDSRAIRLPSEVESDKVEATYKNGVLKIHLPKTKEESAKKIDVEAA